MSILELKYSVSKSGRQQMRRGRGRDRRSQGDSTKKGATGIMMGAAGEGTRKKGGIGNSKHTRTGEKCDLLHRAI
jgi:hypothetical protein